MSATAAIITPVLLIILDGFGHRDPAPDNAIELADTPNWDRLWADFPRTLIDASELHVGLPAGQMGNSEVGHLNIGAGRVVYQDYTRIELAIRTGDFARNPALAEAMAMARTHRSTLHVLGLLSPGGVHSHEMQLQTMVAAAAEAGVPAVAVHAFLDGRDTPPQSAEPSLAAMAARCAELAAKTGSDCRIATIAGRYYAMDRDQRWDRVQTAYGCIVAGRSPQSAPDVQSALKAAYARGETDEFVKPTVIGAGAQVMDGDVVVFMNFRADRARELTQTLIDPDFKGFAREGMPRLSRFVTLTHYSDEISANPLVRVAFEPQAIHNSFGEVVAVAGLKQLRIAETEKYAHVTFFFNGGRETEFPGESRILVPSPKVATYDLKPEMSAEEVTDRLIDAIDHGRFDVIVVNYANTDMVGHSGDIKATIKAVETVDHCLGRLADSVTHAGGTLLITADHGNAEMMRDPVTHEPHTAHTTNPVPLVLVSPPAGITGLSKGRLADVAPTLLALLGLSQPSAMTGRPLLLRAAERVSA